MSDAEIFDQWAILELMGHRQLAGRVREWEVAGCGFLRVDIYPDDAERPAATQLYNPRSAVYGLHPVTEEAARAFAARSAFEPVARWQLEPLPAPPSESQPVCICGPDGAVDNECELHGMPF